MRRYDILWNSKQHICRHRRRKGRSLPGVCFPFRCFSMHRSSVELGRSAREAMSLFQRITRAFHTLSTIELDEQSRFGALGELSAEQILDDGQAICINNPIVPHPTKPGLSLESDFLIYTQGNLFCVEIKHYKGRLYYPPRERVGQGSPLKGPLARPPLQGFDDSIIIQEKLGNYGEGIFLKEHRNAPKT